MLRSGGALAMLGWADACRRALAARDARSALARRIGARAPFVDALSVMDALLGRIGIRSQICYRLRNLAGLPGGNMACGGFCYRL